MSDDFDFEALPDEQVPAASGSLLSGLRARRAKAAEKLHLDLKVPRMDPPVYVRFRPLTNQRIEAANKAASKSKDKDASVIAAATLLADACLGVFEVVDDVEVSIDAGDPNGDWPTFDKRLAGLLGLEVIHAADVVRGLYLTDGDVIATSAELVEWSGYTTTELARDDAGN